MTNAFSRYERGLEELLKRLGKGHSGYLEALTLINRLQENIDYAKRYGSTETRRANRAQIVESLNQFTLETLGTSFSELCGLPTEVQDASVKLQVYEEQYLERVREECRNLYTEGIDRVTHQLEKVFIMLQAVETRPREMQTDIPPSLGRVNEGTKRQSASGEGRPQERSRPKPKLPPPPVSLSIALQKHQHLVILGDPGSGKTTTLQFMALCFAQDGWMKELGWAETRIPVRVELRGYGGEKPLGELLVQAVAEVGRFVPVSTQDSQKIARSLLETWLTDGRLIVLLDGLDEVLASWRKAVVKAINRFVRKEGRACRVLVTARIAGYRSTRLLEDPFASYTIRPFTGPNDALPYASGWLKVMPGWAQEEADDIDVKARALLEKMDRQGLKSVMGNPLFLRLAVTIYADKNEVVRDRAELCRRYIDEVLTSREQERRLDDVPWSRQQVKDALRAVAWRLQKERQERRRRKTAAELGQIINDVVDVKDGEEMVGYLRERLGLLAGYGYEQGEQLAFRYSTFREFFVAQRLAEAWKVDREQTWEFLCPRLHHTHWREPLLFLAAMLEDREATGLVERVLNAKSPYERVLCRDLLLAGECLKRGATLGVELRHTIIDKFLKLYLEHTQGVADRVSVPELLVIQRVEPILSTLKPDDRSYLAALLLDMVKGTEQGSFIRIVAADIVSVGKMLILWPLFVSVHLFELIKSLLDWLKSQVGQGEDLQRQVPKELGASEFLKRDFGEFLDSIVFPIHIPDRVRRQRKDKQNSRQRVAIKALGEMKISTPEITSALLSALEDIAIRGLAAEALGRIGPGTDEVVMALVEARRKHRLVDRRGWDQTVRSIVEALGLLGQRYPGVVGLLLVIVESRDADTADTRYAVTWALCKAAETNIDAMAFVLEGWHEIYNAQRNATAWTAMDEGVREGLRDGRKLFNSASPEVIRYLVGAIQGFETFREAGEFLSTAVGDSPLVQCKAVDEDGSERYITHDLTDEVFDVFLRRPLGDALDSVGLGLLVRWGLNRPELITRLINVIQAADAWILAMHLEEYYLRNPLLCFRQLMDSKPQSLLKQSIARLRSPDKATRDAELHFWLEVTQSAPADSALPFQMFEAIETFKCIILNKVYRSACHRIFPSSLGEEPPALNPHAVAALACFRVWYPGDLPYPRTTEETRNEFLIGTDQSLSLLQNPDKQAIEILSPVLAGKEARFFTSDLRQKWRRKSGLEDKESDEQSPQHKRSKPRFAERSMAAYVMAQLATDYPGVQDVLLSNLKALTWGEEKRSFEEEKFQEHLVRALGHVEPASPDLVEALIEISKEHNDEIVYAGTSAIARLHNPSGEAVSLLIKWYEELDKSAYHEKSSIVKALGTVESYSPQTTSTFLKALADESLGIRDDAAVGLARVTDLNPEIVDALLAAINSVPPVTKAASALGYLAGSIASFGELRPLRKCARTLRKTLHRCGEGQRHNDVYEALERIVEEITTLEARSAPTSLPLSESGMIRRTQPSWIGLGLSVIASAILGLASNVVASYLQRRYRLIDDPTRLTVVVLTFLASLTASIGLSWCVGKSE